jgi:prepilin-type N-terminal cleavage/methylation domain-containing protein
MTLERLAGFRVKPIEDVSTGATMKAERGFTLVEILIALTVFLIGAVGLISLMGIAATSHQRAISFSSASRLAEDLFAMVQSRMMVNDGSNGGLIPEDQPLPEDIPADPDAFVASAKYPGFEYKVMFQDVNPSSQAGLPGAQPEIMAVIYVRWPSEGNDFRAGEKNDSDPPNNFEGRVFYSVILKKPW